MEIIKTIGMVLFAASLAACGGGNGGSGSNKDIPRPHPSTQSLSQLNSTYLQLRNKAYTGSRQEVTLDPNTFADFSIEFLVRVFNNESQYLNTGATSFAKANMLSTSKVPLHSNSNQRKPIFHNRNYILQPLNKPDINGLAKTNAEKSRLNSKPIEVDEDRPCDVSGHINFEGTLDDVGLGGLRIEYVNCVNDNGVNINGVGAVYYIDQYTPHRVVFYDGITYQLGQNIETLTGSVEAFNPQANYDIKSNLAIHFSESDRTIQIENYTERFLFDFSDSYTSENGKFYLSDLGYVTVNTLDPYNSNHDKIFPEQGSIGLIGANNSNGLIDFFPHLTRFRLDQNGNNNFDIGLIAKGYELASYGIDVNAFKNVAELNFPPTIDNIIFITQGVDTTNEIEVEASGITDLDNNPISLHYDWRVNNILNSSVTGPIFPAGLAKVGDVVTVQAIASDGQDSFRSYSITQTLLDAPSRLEISAVPTTVNEGESLQFDIFYVDPDIEGTLSNEIRLLYGPTGATFNQNQTLMWTAEDTIFGVEQTYAFGFQLADGSGDILRAEVQVIPTNKHIPLARSLVKVPNANFGAIAVGNFDNDPINEILVSDPRDTVMLLQKNGSDYSQQWVYPFGFDTNGKIARTFAVDIDKNGVDDPAIVTHTGVYTITDLDDKAREVFAVDIEELIRDATIDDIDDDGNLEIALLIARLPEPQSFPPLPKTLLPTQIRVIDLVTGIEEWRLDVIEPALRASIGVVIESGNVDNDAAKELVTSGGYVIDAVSRSVQWHYEPTFVDHNSQQAFMLVDANNDGIQEILATEYAGPLLTLYSAITQEAVWTSNSSIPTNSIKSMHQSDVDNDGYPEILLGTVFESIVVLKVDTGTPVYSYTIDQGGISSPFINDFVTAGDTDSDGFEEIIWSAQRQTIFISNFQSATPSLWYNEIYEEDQFAETSYYAGGFVNLSPGNSQATFLASEVGFRERLIFSNSEQIKIQMSADGNLTLGNIEPAPTTSELDIELADFDNDGFAEIYYSTVDQNNSNITVQQASNLNQLYTSPLSSESASKISVKDLNRNGLKEAILIDGNVIRVIDIFNQVEVWSSPDTQALVTDFDVIDLLGDQNLEIIIATENELQIWSSFEDVYALQNTIDISCERVLAQNFRDLNGLGIVCLEPDNFDSPVTQSSMSLYDTELNSLAQYLTNGKITDLSSLSVAGGFDLLVGTIDAYYSDARSTPFSRIQTLSALSGDFIWSSPPLLGKVMPNSLYPFTDSNNKPQILFGTNSAMMLTK